MSSRGALTVPLLAFAVLGSCASSDAGVARDGEGPGAADAPRAPQDGSAGVPGLASGCGQSLLGPAPPKTTGVIEDAVPVRPFYQWENNSGYCGETSMMEAGLSHGQWASQYNARLLCGAQGNGQDAPVGAPLLQTGPSGFCAANQDTPDYNAQLLLEAGAAAYAGACLSNFRLAYTTYDTTNNTGMAGYRDFMAWVKREVIAGHQVTIGVLEPGGTDSQYDHIVTVARIGTNHATTDGAYYEDDVLYVEDHGAYTFTLGDAQPLAGNPAIPPGTPPDTGCTPYIFGFPFGALPATRGQANADAAPAYSILIPGVPSSQTGTGGNGVDNGPPVTGHNYGFSVSGPETTDPTLPVTMRIAKTATEGETNPVSPLAGCDYERPFVGTSNQGASCTNDPPSSWMSMTLVVTVSGVVRGRAYRLYEYDTDGISGVGAAAALDVPLSGFNASASRATGVTPFVATGTTFETSVTRESSTTVVFRAVAADAP